MKAFIATIALMASVTASAGNVQNGTLSAYTEGNAVVIKIQNSAAKLVFEQLANAKEEVQQTGSLTRTTRFGRDVTCESLAAIVTTYSCGFKIDDTGAVVK